jgi:aspartyl-tRNA(Asn)/glutamyl-tRNA(Gln) amidotransferase subunit A
MPGDPLSRPLTEIARDLREGGNKSSGLDEAAIARHERFGERLHAYSHWAPQQARAVAEAAGAAFVAGVTAPAARPAGFDQGPVCRGRLSLLRRVEPAAVGGPLGTRRAADREAAPTTRVITGKTHMVEFAFGGTGQNSHSARVSEGRSREDKAVPMATMPGLLSLCPQAVSIDESPVDLEAEAGSVVEVQVTVAQFRMLTKDAVSQRISLRPTV